MDIILKDLNLVLASNLGESSDRQKDTKSVGNLLEIPFSLFLIFGSEKSLFRFIKRFVSRAYTRF